MMRKFLIGSAALIALAAAAFFLFAPAIVESGMNKLTGKS